MMGLSRIRTILLGVGVLLSLLALALSAAASAQKYGSSYYDGWGYGWYGSYYLVAYRGVIALGVLSFLWFVASLILAFVAKALIVNAIIVDVTVLATLFVIGLGTSGWATAAGNTGDGLGAAAIAFGWLLTFFILGLLVFTVVFTLTRYGGSMAVWRSTLWSVENGDVKTSRDLNETAVQQPGVMQQQPVYAQQPMQGQMMQQPMQQPQQSGFVVQQTPGQVPPQFTGNSVAPQQTQTTGTTTTSPPSTTGYTVNLAQPTAAQSQERYTVDINQPGGAAASKV